MDDDSVSEAEEYEIFESENKLEPRYLDSWQQKIWLKTGDSQPSPVTRSILEVPMPENKSVVEMHGCIVCARTFNVLAVYTPDGRLVDCKVTSPEGHCVPGERQPLVACNSHTAEKIEAAYQKWQSRNDTSLDDEQEDER